MTIRLSKMFFSLCLRQFSFHIYSTLIQLSRILSNHNEVSIQSLFSRFKFTISSLGLRNFTKPRIQFLYNCFFFVLLIFLCELCVGIFSFLNLCLVSIFFFWTYKYSERIFCQMIIRFSIFLFSIMLSTFSSLIWICQT